MNNRYRSLPILGAVALSLVPVLISRAEPGVGDTASTPTNAALPVTPAPVVTPAPAPAPVQAEANPATYTVVSGDSYWTIAQKFHVSVKKLKAANNAKNNNLKPGQILKIPATANTEAAPPPPPEKPTTSLPKPKTPAKIVSTTKPKKAAPVDQDLDVSPSTFASCPVPEPVSETSIPVAPVVKASTITKEKAAPRAEIVSPEELAAAAPKVTPPATDRTTTASSLPANRHSSKASGSSLSLVPVQSNSSLPALPKLTSRQPDPLITTPASDWANRFLSISRDLGEKGIDYNESWRPPGESKSWVMDCSNTARYIYKATAGIELPRTASDQYYYLHLQNKAWDVPQTSTGFADCNFLRRNLKVGDLLFWENTYKPERQPPITHVMVFLGTNEKGQWIMAGSQTSRGGVHNRRHGGPDIYVFDPTKPCGGYSTWLGMVHHQGRFCAYGRPLDADKTKLAVANN